MALKALDSEDLTVDATAGGVSFTASKATLAGVIRARCAVETAQIRIQTNPDVTLLAGSIGELFGVGSKFFVYGGEDLKNFKAIRTGDVSGKLVVTYEGAG